MSEHYKLVAESPNSTVAAEMPLRDHNSGRYQSEAQLEATFIKQLCAQGYEYLNITCEAQLIANLRKQLERLNNYTFSDNEWDKFFREQVAKANDGIAEKSFIIQEDHIRLLTTDDGQEKNIRLLDKKDITHNSLQVINQYVPEGGARNNRYDVTILVNGLPLVHVELKRRGVSIKEAFNQIRRYNRESFWAGSGLFEYVQLFVISNGTETKYYSNTTRTSHIKEMNGKDQAKSKNQTSNSFEFTSYWALTDNRVVMDLEDFTKTFFLPRTLLNIITKYCILTSEKILLVMRPYQIAATEAMLLQIKIASNYHKYGTIEGGGYIWHTTGSGKTVTSFKAAQLASKMDEIDKVLFVVDRKDLDYQTMREYDRFAKGAANSNTDTKVLTKQMNDDSAKIIITTIQKLSIFVKKNPAHPILNKHIVFIFDECHRSQFGDMHALIVKTFKKFHLFGFTGTPIFSTNANKGCKLHTKTTDAAFGKRLHVYTIIHAINDGNVLPFRVDYISTMREEENILEEQVKNIDRERALNAPERISQVTQYILNHFNQKTLRNTRAYAFNQLTNTIELAASKKKKVVEKKQTISLKGFNSIFAVSSIDSAKLYYNEFKRQINENPEAPKLKIAIIYSYGANEDLDDVAGYLDDENPGSTASLDQSSRDFLDRAIEDYNSMFGTSYDTSSDKFQNYYKDVSLRMKNREIDLLIVVNMFLTGFDATTLNTLWVDKNLRMHGLLQAYSRTNRILNSIKTFGNIICFRNLEKATNESLALFGDKEAGGTVVLRTYDEYYEGYDDEKGKHPGYRTIVDELQNCYPLNKYSRCELIVGEEKEKAFIKLYTSFLRAYNLLSSFDQFAGHEILTERQIQDYHSIYLSLYEKYRKADEGEVVDINDDIVFEIELIKHQEIDIDYILYLISQLHENNTKDKEIELSIEKAVLASPSLRDKKELIEQFIHSLNGGVDIDEQWNEFVKIQQQEHLTEIIMSEHLKLQETVDFMRQCFKDGEVAESGVGIANLLPPMSLFSKDKDSDRSATKKRVLKKLKAFFDRFYDISGGILNI